MTWSVSLTIVGVALVGVVVLLWWIIQGRDRMELARSRRNLEREIIKAQIALLAQDPLDPGVRASIANLNRLQAVAIEPAPSGAKTPLQEATTFPGGVARLGYRIFKWLLALAVLLLAVLTWYGLISYPNEADVNTAVTGQATPDRLAAAKQLQYDWLQQIKDLGQLFLLTPIFPLIGAVIGYIFGVRKSEAGDNRDNGETGDNGDNQK
jgi:hypothetical protein